MRSVPVPSKLDKRGLIIVCGVLQALLIVILTVETLVTGLSYLRPIVAVIYLTFVPGVLLVSLLGLNNSAGRFVAYSIGLSMITIMIVGGVMSVTLPTIGVSKPLSTWVFAPTMGVVVGSLMLAVRSSADSFEVPVNLFKIWSPVPLALLLLPLLSIIGTFVLNRFYNNTVLLLLFTLIALIPLSISIKDWMGAWKPLAVWSVAITLVYHGSLGPYSGGHQLSQLTLDLGRWVPNYADGIGSLLANGVLYPSYAIFSGVRLGVEWGAINPFLISFLPVFLYLIFKTQTEEVHALLASCLFMFAFPFYTLYPGGGRVSTPVFFLALVGLALTDQSVPRERRKLLALIFAPAITVSHYGTAWVVMFGFGMSICVLGGIYLRDKFAQIEGLFRRKTHPLNPFNVTPEWKQPIFLTPISVAYYCVFSFGWYLYTGLSGKFKTLPNHIASGLEGIVSSQAATGAAARSVTKNYGSTSVAFSRWVYIAFGALMGLGVAIALMYRLYGNRRVEDEFLALGAGFLSILVAAFLPFSTGFNTARVMMIVFTFTAPFAVIGLAEIAKRAGARLSTTQSLFSVARGKSSVSIVSVMLAIFLLLNSGVIAATVTNDYAPSNKLLSQQLLQSEDPIERTKATACGECNVQTHAWAFSHLKESWTLYGDDIAEAQVDYNRGRITEQIGEVPYGSRYESIWLVKNGTTQTSLLVVLPHNVDTGGVFFENKYNWKEFNGVKRTLNQSQKVYEGGMNGSVYYLPKDDGQGSNV